MFVLFVLAAFLANKDIYINTIGAEISDIYFGQSELILKTCNFWATDFVVLYTSVICICLVSVVLDGPEGGTLTVGDYYRAAKDRKLHYILCRVTF